MLALLQAGEAELVVGSRYIEGGSADSFNRQRAGASALATEVAKRVLRVKIADPMSGFFMIRRDRFEQLAPQLSTQGFKILLDIVATARGDLKVKVCNHSDTHSRNGIFPRPADWVDVRSDSERSNIADQTVHGITPLESTVLRLTSIGTYSE